MQITPLLCLFQDSNENMMHGWQVLGSKSFRQGGKLVVEKTEKILKSLVRTFLIQTFFCLRACTNKFKLFTERLISIFRVFPKEEELLFPKGNKSFLLQLHKPPPTLCHALVASEILLLFSFVDVLSKQGQRLQIKFGQEGYVRRGE